MSLLMDKLLGMPFGTATVEELLRSGLLDANAIYRRWEIVEALRQRFIDLGGDMDTSPQQVIVPLKRVLDGPLFTRIRPGFYRYLGPESDDSGSLMVRDAEPVSAEQPSDCTGRAPWRSELNEASTAHAIVAVLRLHGRERVADRIHYLQELAREDPEEEPMALGLALAHGELSPRARAVAGPGSRCLPECTGTGGVDASRHLGQPGRQRPARNGVPVRGDDSVCRFVVTIPAGHRSTHRAWNATDSGDNGCRAHIHRPNRANMKNEPLPDRDHVARYCKPSAVDERGYPTASAFAVRAGENYLSVNWLEHFGMGRQAGGMGEIDLAVDQVRATLHSKGFQLRPNGRFALLSVGGVKTAIRRAFGRSLHINHLPVPGDPSHAGILGYGEEDFMIAAEIRAAVRAKDVRVAV